MPVAGLKVSGDKPGGSVPVKNICWHTATKKRYLQAQPLPWNRPQHICRTGDPPSPLALQIGLGAGTLSMDSQFVGWPPRSKRRPDQMIVILQEVWVRKRKISEVALGDKVKVFFFFWRGGGGEGISKSRIFSWPRKLLHKLLEKEKTFAHE